MILYNITYNIEKEVEARWLDWIRSEYIPKMKGTGCFRSVRFFQLLNVQDEGSTYSLQFMTDSLDTMQQFLDKHAYRMAEEHNIHFKDKHVAFQTVLQELEL